LESVADITPERPAEIIGIRRPDHFQRGDTQQIAKRLVTRLKNLGYEVELKAAA
jgi:hypothetical protein